MPKKPAERANKTFSCSGDKSLFRFAADTLQVQQ
jgi:hypothetical protein